ncbi:MAG TPA: redoxin domain-containing protein [Candidatus Fournierella merdigallinarum]|nr:redoxin domain-containing protein [Candidatus Fournierella merdigallinarum]
MGFTIETSVSALTVFAQGLLSFFSPCVLPLIPLYLGYLTGGAAAGELSDAARRRLTLRNTLFFILGVSFAFFLLGLGFTSLGRFFTDNRALVARIGGVIIVLLGLVQLGFLESRFMQREWRLPFDPKKWGASPLAALALGFTFSFAWTPCVGPALTSVLLMAASAATRGMGFVLIGVYTLGFVIPFLLVGLFTSQVLAFFRRHGSWLKWTARAGGVLLILMGVMMFTGWMNGFTAYLSGLPGAGTPDAGQSTSQSAAPSSESAPASSGDDSQSSPPASDTGESDADALPGAPDFTLVDQNGQEHTLSDYKGQVVFLNFWATWCGPCQREMPEIQALYEDWGENAGEVVVLGVANPKNSGYPGNADNKTADEVAAMLAENGYTYPTVMDETGEVFAQYGISVFPTTFMIDAEGNVFGYITGSLTREIMDSIVEQTRTGVRQQ